MLSANLSHSEGLGYRTEVLVHISLMENSASWSRHVRPLKTTSARGHNSETGSCLEAQRHVQKGGAVIGDMHVE